MNYKDIEPNCFIMSMFHVSDTDKKVTQKPQNCWPGYLSLQTIGRNQMGQLLSMRRRSIKPSVKLVLIVKTVTLKNSRKDVMDLMIHIFHIKFIFHINRINI